MRPRYSQLKFSYAFASSRSSLQAVANSKASFISLDQRLSAFGALTLGLKADYRLDDLWSIDAKLESYKQRGNWRIGGGSPGLAAFNATSVMFGANRKF